MSNSALLRAKILALASAKIIALIESQKGQWFTIAYFRIDLNLSTCTGWNLSRSMLGLPRAICRNSSIYSLNYPGSILCVIYPKGHK